MRIALAADHAGFELKTRLADDLRKTGHEVDDLGAHAFVGDDDYTDYAAEVGRAIAGGRADRGLLICGSGVGATVAANKIRGVRACVCHDTYSAHQGVEHDDVNVLVLGSRIVGPALATELVGTFLSARFSGEPRHVRRLQKIAALESANS